MKGKVSAALETFKLFCAKQVQNFYVGLAISALAFLALFSSLSMVASAAICPFLTAATYMTLRFACGGSFEWKGDYGLKNSLFAVTAASLYMILLAFI